MPGECVRSCDGLKNGDYQSCITCDNTFASCLYGVLYDNRSCSADPNVMLYWNDLLKQCVWDGQENTCNGFGKYVKSIILLCVFTPLPFKPSRCLKTSFYIPENTLNFSTTKGFRTKTFMKLVYQYKAIVFNFKQHPIIFIHCKSRIAIAIRGL